MSAFTYNLDVGLHVRPVSQTYADTYRILSAEVALGQALIDNGRTETLALDVVRIPLIEVTAARQRRAKSIEEPRADRVAVHGLVGHDTAAGRNREHLIP